MTTKTNPTKVLVAANSESGQRPITSKYLSTGTVIQPGQLLDLNASQQIIVHGTADGIVVPRMVAIENVYGTNNALSALLNTYAIGDSIPFIFPQPGDLLYMLIAASAVLVEGQTLLSSNGAGALQAITPLATTLLGSLVARAEQTITIGGTADYALVRIT